MRKIAVILAAVGLLGGTAPAADKIAKGKYRYVEIGHFENAQGVDVPTDYQVSVMEDLIKHLHGTKGIQNVLRAGEKPSDSSGPVLQITGSFTEYKPGNRAERYLVGFGAGATKIVAQVKFVDSATGSVLLERKVDGKVIIGVFGGNSEGATNGLAKEVAKVTKDRFF